MSDESSWAGYLITGFASMGAIMGFNRFMFAAQNKKLCSLGKEIQTKQDEKTCKIVAHNMGDNMSDIKGEIKKICNTQADMGKSLVEIETTLKMMIGHGAKRRSYENKQDTN